MKSTDIHIALCFDERFWAPAYATMRSICLTSKRRGDLIFHLCHPGLSTAAQETLARIGDEFSTKVTFHDIGKDPTYRHLAATLEHSRHISEIMYARLLLDQVLGRDVGRAIYVDCDILIRAPIETLHGIDLKERPLGAVKDVHAMVSSNRRDIARDRDLFDPADPYFNSGLLVIDLDAWRALDMVKTLKRLEDQGVLTRLYHDQQVLNYVFKNNWTPLDPSWNVFGVNTAIEMFDPKGVHYTGPTKPWNLINPVPFRRVYRHVMTNAVYYRYWRQRMWWKLTGGPKGPRS